jgi:hypothetical protein
VRTKQEDDPSVSAICYLIALTLGQCELFGIEPPTDVDIPRNEFVARHAADAAAEATVGLTNDLGSLDDLVSAANSQIDVDEVVCSPIESRMDLWAVIIGIETMIDADDSCCDSVRFRESHSRFLGALDQYDHRLQHHKGLLALACETELLDNYRNGLSERFTESLPWWLDGSLELTLESSAEQNWIQLIPQGPTRGGNAVTDHVQSNHGPTTDSKNDRPWIRHPMVSLATAAAFLFVVGFWSGRFVPRGAERSMIASVAIDTQSSRAVGPDDEVSVSVTSETDSFATIILVIDGEDLLFYPKISQSDGIRIEAAATVSYGPILIPRKSYVLTIVSKTSATSFLRSELGNESARDPENLKRTVSETLTNGGHQQFTIVVTRYDPES